MLLLVLAGTSVQAQTKLPPRRKTATPKARTVIKPGAEMLKDGVIMKDSKILLTELGHTGPLAADKTLINGTKITTTGLITTPDGTTTQLQEGDQMSLSGRVTTKATLAQQDSLRKMMDYDTKLKSMTKDQRKRLKEKEKADEEKAKRMAKKDKSNAKG
jgi:hypothetical protein